MIHERIVPISQIEHYYNIKIQTPPPYRGQLGIHENVLESALNTLKLRDTPIRVNFFRNEPRVSIAPDGTGGASAITSAVEAEQEKQKPPSFVTMDISGNIIMMLPYRDNETTNPEKTADHSSKMFRKALQKVPAILYLHEMIDADNTEDSVVFKEIVLSVANTTIDIPLSLLMSTGLLETEMIITHNPPLNFGELYIISTLLTYGLSILRSYDWARKYKQGRCENHIEEEFGEFVSENPRRALYPVKFVEELLVPSALYWFQKISENNIIVPISTPTVR